QVITEDLQLGVERLEDRGGTPFGLKVSTGCGGCLESGAGGFADGLQFLACLVTFAEIRAAELLDEARDLLIVGIVGDGRNERQHQQQKGETANQPGGHGRLLAKSGQRGARQMRAVPSPLAEAMRLPSGKNATLVTIPVWP